MFKLAIDPGHGGPDRGAEAYVVESVINLIIGLDLEYALAHSNWPIETMMTRRTNDYDKRLTNTARGKMTKDWGADFVLSLHCNNAPNAHGLRTFYWAGNEYGLNVAADIQRCAPVAVYRHGRNPKAIPDAGYPRVKYVLAPHKATCVLVELGFVSSQNDAQALKSVRRRREFVACLMMGIARAMTLHTD